MEGVISTVRTLMEDLAGGSTKCFEVAEEDLDTEGGGYDVYDQEEGEGQEGQEETAENTMFEEAYQELYECGQVQFHAAATSSEQDQDRVTVMASTSSSKSASNVPGGGSNELAPDHSTMTSLMTSTKRKEASTRHPRLVKRLNTRTVMWLTSYSHSNYATTHMLDRMWSTALK